MRIGERDALNTIDGEATGAGGLRTAASASLADTTSRLAVGIVLVGVGLRLWLYLQGASLWLDEAMLANNIVNRAYASLLQRLDHDQGAPVGFLFLQNLHVFL